MFDIKTFENGEILFVKQFTNVLKKNLAYYTVQSVLFINYKICLNYFKLVGKIS